ncbi:MAG: galactose mutarotase [Clostridiales bacterium]|nr:galactose mutarotase [Clostridiales bacterium]
MIKKEPFGRMPEGSAVYAYTLENSTGVSAKITNFGGIIISLWVTDKDGKCRDVVCGFDDLDGYLKADGYQGALIGRVTNRIRGASFELDGKEYALCPNFGDFSAHGGKIGFNRRVWGVQTIDGDEPALILTYVSPDMEEGYPGTLTVTVTYQLTASGGLSIRYEAFTDKKTIVNMTNHAYFNLDGYETGSVADQIMWVDADTRNEHDADIIPTGKILPVKGTPYDFTQPKAIGRDFDSDPDMEKQAGGYDNNFIFNHYDGEMRLRASLHSPASGIKMQVLTNQPCIGIYTANMLNPDDVPFKGGVRQTPRGAVCFETQKMPDAVHHPNFTDTTLSPDEHYDYTTVFQFAVDA